MSNPKLFIDAHVFDGEPQGTTTYLQGLYNSFVKDGAFECILAANDINQLKTHFDSPEFRFIKLPSRFKIKRLAWDIPKIISENRFDYAHFQYVLPLQKRCKEIVTIHDVLFLDFPHLFSLKYRLSKDFLFRHAAKRADLVLTVSGYSRNALVKHYRIDPDKIVVTPNGILNDFFTLEGLPDIHKKYKINKFILYVSRIEPRKNHIILMQAFIDLKLYKKDYSLVFIGSCENMPHTLKSLYNELPKEVKEKIYFLNNVNQSELKAFYRKCSLFVYPSLAEGFGIPPLEAVSAGATTLCSNTTAMSEFTFLGNKLFDPNDYNELKDKISFYIENPNTAENIDFEKKEITKRYNWDNSAAIFINAIPEIL